MIRREPSLLMVLAGTFESQPAAFGYLAEAASHRGLVVDLADVDVIRMMPEVRLAHYFRPQIVARIEALRGADDTVIVLRPCELSALPDFPTRGTRLRLLGRFAGEIVTPRARQDWT